MQKNPMLLGLLLTSTVVILSYVLTHTLMPEKTLTYLVDNPTPETIKVQIDRDSYILAPKSHISISLAPGSHTLNKVDTFQVTFTKQGLINPTRSRYFLYTQYYGALPKKDSVLAAKDLVINDFHYLQTDTISNFFITDFYYNLNEDFPSFSNSQRDSLHHDKRVKIFSASTFDSFYNTQLRR